MTQLMNKNFSQKRSLVNEWYAKPEFGTPLEAVLEPRYWAHCSSQLAPEDVITVMPEGAAWRAELLVLDAGTGFAKVVVINSIDLDKHEVTGELPSTDDYDVRWTGRHTKWRVIRKSDKKVMVENQKTKQDAYGWISNHKRAMAA
jgi:hypothetical protein